jgi:anthranilate synthase component 2
MLLLIDNYDSFTYNLVHYVEELGRKVTIKRNDKITVDEAINLQPEAIMLSPGPSNPTKAGICLNLILKAAAKKIPLLGVCLGHQAIGQAFGGKIKRAPEIMHGKTSKIHHNSKGIFKNIENPFVATRYHSLIVDQKNLPNCLEVTANVSDSTIMALEHKELPIFGVQFHPESIASKNGKRIIENFFLSI